jgi:hypothetical protein
MRSLIVAVLLTLSWGASAQQSGLSIEEQNRITDEINRRTMEQNKKNNPPQPPSNLNTQDQNRAIGLSNRLRTLELEMEHDRSEIESFRREERANSARRQRDPDYALYWQLHRQDVWQACLDRAQERAKDRGEGVDFSACTEIMRPNN